MTYAKTHQFTARQDRVATLPVGPFTEFVAAATGIMVCVLVPAAFMLGGSGLPLLAALGAYAIAASLTGRVFLRSYPHGRLGLCNVITMGRLALSMALLVPLFAGSGGGWAVFGVAAVALMLDGVDGWFARRQGLASEFGARFDMEVDSVLALILAASAALVSGVGGLALVLGLPRYAFAGAARVLPWLRRDLPERFSRKAVCVLQLGTLIALQAPILPTDLALSAVLLSCVALIWSFASDVVWLWRRRA